MVINKRKSKNQEKHQIAEKSIFGAIFCRKILSLASISVGQLMHPRTLQLNFKLTAFSGCAKISLQSAQLCVPLDLALDRVVARTLHGLNGGNFYVFLSLSPRCAKLSTELKTRKKRLLYCQYCFYNCHSEQQRMQNCDAKCVYRYYSTTLYSFVAETGRKKE